MRNLSPALINAANFDPIENHVRNATRLRNEAIAEMSAAIWNGVRRLFATAISPLDTRVAAARNKKEVSPLTSAASAQL